MMFLRVDFVVGSKMWPLILVEIWKKQERDGKKLDGNFKDTDCFEFWLR